jgi:RNA polymerase sigma-70 factor (ECF subfamily)
VAARDGMAFETLYRGYCPRLRRFVARITRQAADRRRDRERHDARRLAQSVELQPRVERVDVDLRHRVAPRVEGAEAVGHPVEFEPDDCPAESAEPEGLLLEEERRATIARALDALSHEQRAVLELCYFDGRSCAEIAGIMRCPVNTVKTRMFHARRRLRVLMADMPAARVA